jgi:hypothetical protein
MRSFNGANAVEGYVGSTSLVVEKVVTTPGSEPIVRAQFDGTLTQRNTKNGTVFEMNGGKTVHIAS